MAELKKKHNRELAEKLKAIKEREEKENEMVESINGRERPTEDERSKGLSKGAFSERDERRDEVIKSEGNSVRRNADEVAQRKQSSTRTEFEDYPAIERTTSFPVDLSTARGRSANDENSARHGRIERGTEERAKLTGIIGLAQKAFESVKMLWFALFREKAIKKIDVVQNRKVLIDEKAISSFYDLEITQTQEYLKNPISLSEAIDQNEGQNQSRGMKFQTITCAEYCADICDDSCYIVLNTHT